MNQIHELLNPQRNAKMAELTIAAESSIREFDYKVLKADEMLMTLFEEVHRASVDQRALEYYVAGKRDIMSEIYREGESRILARFNEIVSGICKEEHIELLELEEAFVRDATRLKTLNDLTESEVAAISLADSQQQANKLDLIHTRSLEREHQIKMGLNDQLDALRIQANKQLSDYKAITEPVVAVVRELQESASNTANGDFQQNLVATSNFKDDIKHLHGRLDAYNTLKVEQLGAIRCEKGRLTQLINNVKKQLNIENKMHLDRLNTLSTLYDEGVVELERQLSRVENIERCWRNSTA